MARFRWSLSFELGVPVRISILGLNFEPEPTGIAPYTTALAKRLGARGHDVEVCTGYPHYPSWQVMAGYRGWSMEERKGRVVIRRLRHYVPSSTNGLGRAALELTFGFRLLTTQLRSPDVVLCVSPALLSSALAMARARASAGWRRPAVGVWVQDIYSRAMLETRAAGGFAASVGAKVERSTLRHADGVAVIHDRFREVLTSNLGVDSAKVRVIRNWAHVAEDVQAERASVRWRLGWREDEVVILHAGNIGAKQGLENVIEAARLADELTLPLRFVLLGDGNRRRDLESLANGVDRIQFLDPLPETDFLAALRAAEILLVNERPGVRDMSVPSKLTSYFSSGMPVLAATECDSVTAVEIALSGAGRRVDPGEPGQLLQAAVSLADSPAVRAALGAAGRNYCRTVLNESSAVGQFEEWLEALAETRVLAQA